MTEPSSRPITHDVFVVNLPFDFTAEQLRELGTPYGSVRHAYIATNHETGKSRGYGFIRYRTREEAERCMIGLSGVEVGGRRVRTGEGMRKAP